MTRKYTESEIRDIIADNLQCIDGINRYRTLSAEL